MFTVCIEKTTIFSVLYPSLNTEFFDSCKDCDISEIPSSAEHIFTSLNRFEVKKNVRLAIEAFGNSSLPFLLGRSYGRFFHWVTSTFCLAALRSMVSTQEFSSCHLVVAGGYDRANAENIAHYKELFECVETLGLNHNQVTFLRSPCKLRLNWGELPFFF